MSDDEQPRPRYGEYAPGYVPGQEAAASPESTPPPVAPAPAPWSAGSQPEYQQPGYSQPGYQQPGSPGFGYRPPVKKRNTVDVVFTVILLVLGLIGALIGVAEGVVFSNPTTVDELLRQQGRDGFHGVVGAWPLVMIVSHLVLYVLAVGLSILSIVKKRISFWIPLSIGVVAAIIFWVAIFAIILSDPTFASTSGL